MSRFLIHMFYIYVTSEDEQEYRNELKKQKSPSCAGTRSRSQVQIPNNLINHGEQLSILIKCMNKIDNII